jgi:translation initiation factor 1A
MKRGGKRKHQKKRKKTSRTTSELAYKDDGQEYGRILRLLGGPNLEILCEDGITRMGVIRGNMRNKVWVTIGDYLLVSLREFQDEKCDVLLKYTQENVRALKTYGEIKEEFESVEEEEEKEIEPFDFNDI